LAALWGGEHGEALLQAGLLPQALEVFEKNRPHMGEFDPFRTNPMFLGVEAAARAMVGESNEARRLLESAKAQALGPDPRYETRFGRAEGWLAFRDGDSERAIEILRQTGAKAVEATHVFWGVEVLHDVVRLGFPERVAALLDATAAETEGAGYVTAIAAHATALAAGDAAAVEAAAKRLRRCGARLLAAEAMAQAARRLHEASDVAAAHRAATLSAVWQEDCGSPSTPALASRPSGLSEREYEIASLVAQRRLTSPQAARELFVSARTVDNHLRSVYRKLGLRNRDALADFWNGSEGATPVMRAEL